MTKVEYKKFWSEFLRYCGNNKELSERFKISSKKKIDNNMEFSIGESEYYYTVEVRQGKMPIVSAYFHGDNPNKRYFQKFRYIYQVLEFDLNQKLLFNSEKTKKGELKKHRRMYVEYGQKLDTQSQWPDVYAWYVNQLIAMYDVFEKHRANNFQISKEEYPWFYCDEESIKIAEAIEKEADEKELVGEERRQFVKTRTNQSIFRKRLLKAHEQCCLCEVNIPSLLIASHINPWSTCEEKERLQTENGLLLCPNHDKLFDQGWISFDDDGRIIISDQIDQLNREQMGIDTEMKIIMSDKKREYMEYHRLNVFEKVLKKKQ